MSILVDLSGLKYTSLEKTVAEQESRRRSLERLVAQKVIVKGQHHEVVGVEGRLSVVATPIVVEAGKE